MIAKKQDISVKYLESIIVVLSKAGLVDGLRGKGGGYRLNRAPGEYSVGQILRLTEGSLSPVACLNCAPNTCERSETCKTLPDVYKRQADVLQGLHRSGGGLEGFCQVLDLDHVVPPNGNNAGDVISIWRNRCV